LLLLLLPEATKLEEATQGLQGIQGRSNGRRAKFDLETPEDGFSKSRTYEEI